MAISLRCSPNGRGHTVSFTGVPTGKAPGYTSNGEEVPSVEAQKPAKGHRGADVDTGVERGGE